MASPTKRKPKEKDETKDGLRPCKVKAKSPGQQAFIDAIEANDVVFGLGPAGSGKTRLSVAKAVEALEAGEVNKIVLVRPCLGLGRTSGFLPGTLEAKVSPYLRPLLDELGDFYPKAELAKLIADDKIELTSLEFIRGRTFKHAFVILDEAQNATYEECRAFLSRLGLGSQYVITGDLTKSPEGRLAQSDLHPSEQGALEHYADHLGDIEGVGIAVLAVVDVVRHPLVKKFLERGL